MGMLGTSRHTARLARASLVMVALAGALITACGDDDDDGRGGDHDGGQAGSGGSDAGQDAGMRCDARGCWVSLDKFQSESLNCPDTYAAAQEKWAPDPDMCVTQFFPCKGLDGVGYQYGFTGDNVQCYYDKTGELVGALRTSDHGLNTLAGNVPNPTCYTGPDCSEEMDGGTR